MAPEPRSGRRVRDRMATGRGSTAKAAAPVGSGAAGAAVGAAAEAGAGAIDSATEACPKAAATTAESAVPGDRPMRLGHPTRAEHVPPAAHGGERRDGAALAARERAAADAERADALGFPLARVDFAFFAEAACSHADP